MAYLLDTDVLIDLFRENQEAAEYIDSLDDWSYSVVTGMELIAGVRNPEETRRFEFFLSAYNRIPLSEEIGVLGYGIMRDYRHAHGLDPADALIAATAITEDLTLATRNRKHFEAIEGLRLEVGRYEL